MNLVTGGTGLTGSHLLFELTKNGNRIKATKRIDSSTDFVKKVFALYTLNVEEQFNLIDWINVDLLDYNSILQATTNVDTVFHTGAVVSFNSSDSFQISQTNVNGTANVVDACLHNNVRKLIHVSSIAALGEPNEQGIINEACLWTKSKGQSAYAKSKFHGEMEVWRGAEQGLYVVVVNPSVILGPGRWDTGSGQLFKRISKGMPFCTPGISGYVDVRDVARAMVLLAEDNTIKNERFILNSQNLSYKEIFTNIAISTGSRPPRIMINPWVIKGVWPFVKIFSILLGKGSAISLENILSAYKKTYYSSDKIKNRLRFDFIPIADSISFIGKAFQNNF